MDASVGFTEASYCFRQSLSVDATARTNESCFVPSVWRMERVASRRKW
jgi:hypothetical protein